MDNDDDQRGLQQHLASLPEDERQFLAFMAIPNSLGMAALAAGSDDPALDELEATAAGKLAEANEEGVEDIQARLADLRDLRAEGREAAQAKLEAAQADAERLADALVAWIQTPDWGASETTLRHQAADLMTDDGEDVLALLELANPGNEQIPMHRQLLRFAREQGINAAYAQLRRELAEASGSQEAERAMAESPLLQAVVAFLQAEDDTAAQVLDERRALLLTADARNLLEQSLQQARQASDTRTAERIAARLALVQAERLARHAAPALSATQGGLANLGSEASSAVQTLATGGEQVKYLVVSAQNCAIGDNALTINNFGVVPLKWHKPEEFQRNLTENAVGRREELADLRRALENGSAAVVGKGIDRGVSGALHGLPGVGKSTLAALYAEAYANDYAGGVLWLQLTPDMTTAESVGPVLSRVAAYAYSLDVQAYRMFAAAQQLPGADPTAALGGDGSITINQTGPGGLDAAAIVRLVGALRTQAPGDPAVQAEIVALLHEMQPTLAEVAAGVRDLQAGQQRILVRFELAEQRIVAPILARLDEQQTTLIDAILEVLETTGVTADELDRHLLVIDTALAEVARRAAQIEDRPLVASAQQVTELASAPGLDAKHKLKVTIPIVPMLLSYEGEIELSSRLDLAKVWRALLHRIDRPNANHFDPVAPDWV